MLLKTIFSIISIFLIAFGVQYFNLLEPKDTHENIEKDFYTSLNLLKDNKEDLGLVLLRETISKNPSQSRILYRENIDNKPYSDILRYDYVNCFDGMIFSSIVKEKRSIDMATIVLAVSYIFSTSDIKMMDEHKKIIELFKKYTKNSKVNLETLAIFEANLLMMENRPDKAYERLAKDIPYSKESIALLRQFSASNDIPLFKSHSKLLKAMGLKNISLNPSQIPYNAKQFFNLDCEKI
jgi:hypothetical protein